MVSFLFPIEHTTVASHVEVACGPTVASGIAPKGLGEKAS
jgi:hypothetical protein